jgi:hypothetical protein
MFIDFSKNGKRYLQCSTRCTAIQFRLLTALDGIEKGFELQLQRLAGFNGQLLEGDPLRPLRREKTAAACFA